MRRRPGSALIIAAFATGGCGAGATPSQPDYRLVTPPPYVAASPLSTPTPGQERRMTARDAAALRPVLASWAAAVRAGEPRRATSHFRLPAIVFQPSFGAVAIRSRRVADAFHAALPCGAELVRARPSGRYVVGTFRLLSRPGTACATPGGLVRVGFVFGDPAHPRRFTEWWQMESGRGPVGPQRRPAAPVAGAGTFG